MSDLKIPKPKYVPFLMADLVMLVVAWAIVYLNNLPLNLWQTALCVLSALVGCVFLIIPFVLEYRAALKMEETEALSSTVEKIQKLEEVAKQITSATNYWQSVQNDAAKIAEATRKIQDQIAKQTKEFTESITRANDIEKATLRVEVEKLEQMHKEYVSVIVGMLDQVYALYRAALNSGNQRIVEQITLFQITCRQIAERIGLVAFDGKRGDKFDSQRHLNVDRKATETANATIAGTLAPGYTYQTKMLRQALVKLEGGKPEQPQPASTSSETPTTEMQPSEAQTTKAASSEPNSQEPQLPGLSDPQQNG